MLFVLSARGILGLVACGVEALHTICLTMSSSLSRSSMSCGSSGMDVDVAPLGKSPADAHMVVVGFVVVGVVSVFCWRTDFVVENWGCAA